MKLLIAFPCYNEAEKIQSVLASIPATFAGVEERRLLVVDDGSADRYQIRLWWKPLVWWIWLGGGLIALGATLSLVGRAQLPGIWRARRARKAEERFAP